MTLFDNPLFLALFNSPIPRIIIKADAPVFTIVISNDAHKVVTNLVGKDIEGKSVWEVFNPDEAGGNGGELLRVALTEAQHGNKTVLMPPFRYDMTTDDPGKMQVKWWQLEISPVAGIDGKPEYLITATNDITQQVLKQHEIEEGQAREKELNNELAAGNEELNAMNEELSSLVEELRTSREDLEKLNNSLEGIVDSRTKALASSEAKFRNLVVEAPVAIALLTGNDFVVDSANAEMLKIWGKDEVNVLGKPILKALPEMEDQPYPDILKQVLSTGIPFYGNEAEVTLHRKTGVVTGYYNFINYPLKSAGDEVDGVMVVANEVTEQVEARRAIEKSEMRLHNLVMKARYPLMILAGAEWKVEIANQELAAFWGMPLSKITGRYLMDILPELKDQPFPAMLKAVYNSGISLGRQEEVFYLNTPAGPVKKYTNFWYDPIFDTGKKVTGIIVSANDVTGQVNARKQLESALEQISLSKKAAQLGTFDLDLVKGTMLWDDRCRELFGISHKNAVSYEADFLPGLHPDDRERISKIIGDLYKREISNGDYDVEYRTVGTEDGKLRWVRAKGKVFFNEQDEPLRFIGSVIEITDQKLEEQRKNDFISMVSHELKTPLTSIKAYVQVLYDRAKKQEDGFAVTSLEKAENQVKKMSRMISGFLNLSRLESGKLQLDLQECDLDELIQDAVNDFEHTVKSHPITIKPAGNLKLRADCDKIEIVITNLLSNAVKYSDAGSPIQITTEVINNYAHVRVKDNGTGISKTDLDKVFDRYYRADDIKEKYVSGFGIGLYLSAKIVQKHNGKIWVESEPGDGAVFNFTLPLN